MELERISPEEAKEKLDADEGYVYLDVRSSAEFAEARAPGAVNVPLLEQGPMGMAPNPNFLAECEEKFAKDAKLITACLRGGRSMKAAGVLVQAGFTAVVDMRGGFDGEMGPGGAVVYEGWARRGLPVEKD